MRNYIKIFIAVLLCLPCMDIHAQSIGKSVVAGAGGSFSGSGILVDWTMGQPVINYATPSSLQVTEGFHPIAADYTTATVTSTAVQNAGNSLSVKAYPNPVSSMLHVSIQLNTADPVSIQVTDVMGKKVKAMSLDGQLNIEADLDLSALAAGTYYITINENKASAQVMKVVKY